MRLIFLLVLLCPFACRIANKTSGESLLVELRTGGCFGYCPVIRLTVRQSGLVEYEGQQFAERQGLDTFRLTKDERNSLRKQVRQVNLWQYPDRIESQVVDAPWATLTVARDGNSKSVVGSMDRPEPLLELENAIKNHAEAHGFQVKRGVNPKEPPIATRREVVVTLQPEQNPGNWIQQFQDIRLLLLRRVSEENKWIVAYDPAEIGEKELLRLFHNTEGVLRAESGN